VVQACNPSYLGCRGRSVSVQKWPDVRLAWGKTKLKVKGPDMWLK
jgi:hypothetical protein